MQDMVWVGVGCEFPGLGSPSPLRGPRRAKLALDVQARLPPWLPPTPTLPRIRLARRRARRTRGGREKSCFGIPATPFRPGFTNFVRAPKKKRAQGRPGARCTRGLMCNVHQNKTHMSIQVKRKQSGLPCAVARRLTCFPGESQPLATIVLGRRWPPKDLTPTQWGILGGQSPQMGQNIWAPSGSKPGNSSFLNQFLNGTPDNRDAAAQAPQSGWSKSFNLPAPPQSHAGAGGSRGTIPAIARAAFSAGRRRKNPGVGQPVLVSFHGARVRTVHGDSDWRVLHAVEQRDCHAGRGRPRCRAFLARPMQRRRCSRRHGNRSRRHGCRRSRSWA